MPCVRIATGSWAAGIEMKMIEAVQSALVCAFKIPAWDRDVDYKQALPHRPSNDDFRQALP